MNAWKTRAARTAASLAVSIALASWVMPALSQDATGVVYFLAPGQQDAARWLQQDAPAFAARLKELAPGLSVEVLDANMDAPTQNAQAETAITKGAKAIVLVSVDENATGGILNSAAAAKVPVVLYDHNALNGSAAARVYYDFYQTGQLQGQTLVDDINDPAGPFKDKDAPIRMMRIFIAHGVSITEAFAAGQNDAWKPLIDAGKIEVVCDDWAVLGGDPFDKQIQQLAEQCLTRTNNGVDAALSLNDQFGTYVMAALNNAGLLGKVPVYGGQDAELTGLQNIIRGYQAATVYKPQLQQAQIAADVVASLVQTGALPAGQAYETYNNGTADIPIVALQASLIRKNDIHKIVQDGLYTWDQICVADIASDPVCQKR